MLKIMGLSYGNDIVQLNNIEFTVESGDFYVICGPDDSGKTEILNAIMGISLVDCGEMLYKGEPVDKLPLEKRKTIRFVPDEILTIQGVTAGKYLESIAKRYKVKEDIGVDKLLHYFDINMDEHLMEMTFESNKMVFIIGALMTGPELLILDEPSNFLTGATMHKLMKLLQRFNSCGMTILMASEHYEQAEEYCNKFMYIKEGNIVNIAKVTQRTEVYRSVAVKGGNNKMLANLFGKPVAREGEKCTYITNRSLSQIGDILKKSGVCECDAHIGTVTMEEMIDRGCWSMAEE